MTPQRKRIRSYQEMRRLSSPTAVAVTATVTSLLTALTLTGCGGGGGKSGSAGTSLTATRNATISMTLKWPGPIVSKQAAKNGKPSRAVPLSAQSIGIAITDFAGIVQTKVVDRPTAGGVATATFDNMASGNASVVFTAYTGLGGTGATIDTTPVQTVLLTPGSNNITTLTYRTTPFTGVVLTPGTTQVLTTTTNTVQISATGYSNGNVIATPATGTWVSSNTAVATVSATGLVTGVSSGTTTITFTDTVSGTNATASVDVTVALYTQVAITAPSAPVPANQTVQLTANGYDNNATLLVPNLTGTWNSSDPTIATVSTTGVITALKAGTINVTFTDAVTGLSNSAPITVTMMTTQHVITVALNPSADQSLMMGATLQVTAALLDNGTVSSSPATGTWTSSNPAVASVSSTGLVTGLTAGSTAITFTDPASGAFQSVNVMVTLTTITLSPGVDQIKPTGTNLQVTATKLVNGSVVSSPATGTWTSSAPAVATVDSTGLVSTIGVGSTTITFTDPATGVAQAIKVVVGQISFIVISPSSVSLSGPGATQALSAAAYDASFQLLLAQAPGTWTSSDTSIATVDSTGIVTAVGNGSATITFLDSTFDQSANVGVTVGGSTLGKSQRPVKSQRRH